MKKIIAAALSLCILGGSVPAVQNYAPESCITANAASIIDSGSCGDNLTWKLDDEGVLTIEGTGEMTSSPWRTEYPENFYKVILPDGLTSIYNYAFYGCVNLTDIYIPDSITSISNNLFSHCSSLTKIQLPDGLISIEDGAFEGCEKLTDINIPESVTHIGSSAFEDCSSLKEITFPLNCSKIGGCVLKNCASLSKVTFLNSDVTAPGLLLHPERSAPEIVIVIEHWAISNNEVEIITYEDHKSVNNEPIFKGTIYAYPNAKMREWANSYCKFESLSTSDLKILTFDSNGAEATMKNIYAEKGSPYVLTECKYNAPLGKVFAGWQIGNKTYMPGDEITVDSDMTITALWEDDTACGESAVWSFDPETGTLTISGTGAAFSDTWRYNYQDMIKKIDISEGITKSASFREYSNLQEISYPSTCKELLESSLEGCPKLEKVTILNPDVEIKTRYINDDTTHWAISNNVADWEWDSTGRKIVHNSAEFNGTIYGLKDSTAEKFAKDYCNFVDIYASLGKVNDDAKTTVADAADVLRECASLAKGVRTFSDEKKLNADLDFNGKITVTDASLILNYSAYLAKGTGEKLSCVDYLASKNIKPKYE